MPHCFCWLFTTITSMFLSFTLQWAWILILNSNELQVWRKGQAEGSCSIKIEKEHDIVVNSCQLAIWALLPQPFFSKQTLIFLPICETFCRVFNQLDVIGLSDNMRSIIFPKQTLFPFSHRLNFIDLMILQSVEDHRSVIWRNRLIAKLKDGSVKVGPTICQKKSNTHDHPAG